MKHTLLIATVVLGIFACNPPDDPPPVNATIEINDTAWNLEKAYAQIVGTGIPSWYKTYIKIDGVDGSTLIISTLGIPDSNLLIPYSVSADFEYYIGSVWSAAVFKGTGTLNLVAQNETDKTLDITFDATVSNGSNNSLKIKSEEGVTDIPYSAVAVAPTIMQMEVQNNSTDWSVSEAGADMTGGGVSWFMLNRTLNPEEEIRFQIPWNLSVGKHTIAPADERALKFYNGNPLIEWVVESAELQIVENSFENGVQKGIFKGVYHHPTIPSLKAVLENCTFEVSYK